MLTSLSVGWPLYGASTWKQWGLRVKALRQDMDPGNVLVFEDHETLNSPGLRHFEVLANSSRVLTANHQPYTRFLELPRPEKAKSEHVNPQSGVPEAAHNLLLVGSESRQLSQSEVRDLTQMLRKKLVVLLNWSMVTFLLLAALMTMIIHKKSLSRFEAGFLSQFLGPILASACFLVIHLGWTTIHLILDTGDGIVCRARLPGRTDWLEILPRSRVVWSPAKPTASRKS